jgi:hypothetical protein
MRRYFWMLAAILILIVVLFGGGAARLYTDWLWFSDLGYSTIFSKIIWTRIGIAALFTVLFFCIVYFNLWYGRRLAPTPTRRYEGIEDELRERLSAFARRGLGILLFAGTLFVAIMVGLQAAAQWDVWLRFSHATAFGTSDPVFGRDIGFYVFRLPFWNFLYGWFFFAILAAAVATGILHYADEGIEFLANTPRFAPRVKSHLAVLLASLFFLKAVGYRLAMYGLVLSPGSIFYGAGYTDIHARLPALWILLVASVIGGIVVLLNIYRRGIYLAAGALAGLILVSLLAGGIYPAIIEQYIVKPNELEKQRPYIERAINYTRQGFRVDAIKSRPFEYVPDLTAQEIANNRAAVQNLRLWDYEPLRRAYNQLQVFQQYYMFQDVDIDRYVIDDSYRQVMLSARELPGPPQDADTWVNRYLRYTHGYGYAMSPVNAVNVEGMPVFFAKGIPPITWEGLRLKVPQVYFGELTNNYVLVNTRRKELDYPVGDTVSETAYDAKSGPMVGSFFRKLAFAIRLGEINILLSDDLRASSRVLFRRNIVDRVQTIFPFLKFDNDPYLVTAGGRLYWFHDAYTTTNQYPYCEPAPFSFRGSDTDVRYIRNSVKLVTDAYTGKVQAFVRDPEDDPIIRTYSRIFPGVFKPLKEMPPEFLAHIRYPEDLFTIQAQVYSKYHMTNPSAFYSRSDLWQMASTPAEDGEGERPMEPYYIITRLPNSSVDEFILIVPFVRPERHNMVAWMAAKCDPEDYGKLIAYEFPRGQTVFGPRQIMARANQDTQISQQLTLWGQLGSRVVRGKLLAIPIENSILYVEPLYLESTATQIPEFKRVIVALGDRLAMEQTLEEAVARVVGVAQLPAVAEASKIPGAATRPPSQPAQPGPGRPAQPPTADIRQLVKQAREQLARAQDLQRRGDWAGYGRELDALQKTLAELERRSGAR